MKFIHHIQKWRGYNKDHTHTHTHTHIGTYFVGNFVDNIK